ncbi:hypothetical protein RH915_02610 [Serpentinicella sp. ANB-PHB4]|nr:hypothetical protein [Serpentinicella sp. ANB-PHB4]MDR5658373.1 hypothetical protein [Serpentinicella sp. ANB-PHB4]
MEYILGILVMVGFVLLIIFKGKFTHRNNKYDYNNHDDEVNIVDVTSDDD